ncbi:MAG TPA: DUF6285 domain-containing protein [Candidatus Dormibacteraeota bacterium]
MTLHDEPSMAALLEAVREFLEDDVLPGTEGRLRFHARVAANVLGIVERELALGEAQDAAHRADLARLGVASEAELAAAIRGGELDARLAEVVAAVRRSVAAKLAVAHPGYDGRQP